MTVTCIIHSVLLLYERLVVERARQDCKHSLTFLNIKFVHLLLDTPKDVKMVRYMSKVVKVQLMTHVSHVPT